MANSFFTNFSIPGSRGLRSNVVSPSPVHLAVTGFNIFYAAHYTTSQFAHPAPRVIFLRAALPVPHQRILFIQFDFHFSRRPCASVGRHDAAAAVALCTGETQIYYHCHRRVQCACALPRCVSHAYLSGCRRCGRCRSRGVFVLLRVLLQCAIGIRERSLRPLSRARVRLVNSQRLCVIPRFRSSRCRLSEVRTDE